MTQVFDGHAILPQTQAFLGQPHRLLIDGEWVDGSGVLTTRDPATGLPLCDVAIGGAAEIDRAVAAARRAFDDGPWSRMAAAERTAILHRFARAIDANAALLAELDILDNGMPRFIAELTAANAVEMVDYYGGAILRIEGTTTAPPRHVSAQGEALTYTLREPVGVAGLIVPWNVPFSTFILKVAPALAAGCTIVVKPSEETPLSALLMGQLLLDSEIPPGVVNIVNGYGATAGERLAEHPDVDKISFTGSTATGRKIVQAATGNLKKVSLELGGKSAVVVLADADLELAIPGVATATFFLQGQNCMAGTRIFVADAIHDQLIDGIAAFAQNMKLGHGLDAATMLGPMISDAHSAKVMGYIEAGCAAGASLVTGGTKLDWPGNFITPTIFADTTPDMSIARDEIFGPVMAVQRLKTDDLDEIARLANDTPFGLSGSVWTTSLSSAHRLAARIRSGHVSINTHGAVGTNIPFGGYGQSGWGREFGKEGIDAYLETKAVTAKL